MGKCMNVERNKEKLCKAKTKNTEDKDARYSHLSNKRDVTLTDFGKFHPAQNKNPPCTFIDFITKLSIFLQNLMKIFLTVILSYKSLP